MPEEPVNPYVPQPTSASAAVGWVGVVNSAGGASGAEFGTGKFLFAVAGSVEYDVGTAGTATV